MDCNLFWLLILADYIEYISSHLMNELRAVDCKLDVEYPQEVCYTNFVYVSVTPS